MMVNFSKRRSVQREMSEMGERVIVLEHTFVVWFKQEIVDELQGGRDKGSKANAVLVLDINELGWSHDSHMINVRLHLNTTYNFHLQ